MKRLLALTVVTACGATPPPVRLTEACPTKPDDYDGVTSAWTRTTSLHKDYQEVAKVSAIFKSPDWRVAHAAREADQRGLAGAAQQQLVTQACADMAGPYEVELLFTTWDRKENDLDRGDKSVWRVRLLDEQGNEIKPIEIVKDKRPTFTLHAEFPTFADFAVAYIARFPRTPPVLGESVRVVRLRMSGERGALEVAWEAGR